ncbi:hydroxyacid dehydrogenase [Candidatus Woesearchaeota archaeon]|nr:hydroxyacid dehydrogenase [Candidatus Woesearchaeota archaeon]
MKIAFYELENWTIPILKKALKKHKLVFSKDKLTKKNVVKDADVLAVFIYSKVNKEILDMMPKLKLVTTRSTGFDHIDLKECKKRKITVCNVPNYGENTVAEHTFALILNISRKIYESINQTRKGDFRLKRLKGFDLKDKTIGIIGCGDIGQHVARIAKGFEMDVLVYDVNKNTKLAKKIGFKYSSLNTLLKKSDIISLHVPENKHTHHMINNKSLKMCKKGVILINTSRGGIVDTEALIKALNKNKVAYAGLDVLEGECYIKEEKALLHPEFLEDCDLKNVLQDNVLLRKPNVYITPHNAFNSKESLYRILDATIKNIKAFLNKKTKNRVI